MGPKRRKCFASEDSDDTSSVYEGVFPLWDRKWLFEDDLWIFHKGMRDQEFQHWTDLEREARARERKTEREKRQQVVQTQFPLAERRRSSRLHDFLQLQSSSSSSSSINNSSSLVDLDLTLDRQTRAKQSDHTVWVVNKGFPDWTGEGIVNKILNLEKLVVFLPQMTNCFNQWIALREIHQARENRRFHGRVRAAIKISSEKLGPECYTVEQGWQADKKWVAYKIIEVRKLFTHCILKQSNEGRPWRVFTTDDFLAETAKLLGAIQMGVTITETHTLKHVSRILGSPTQEKKVQKEEKQRQKKEYRQNRTHFEKKEDGRKCYVCCDKMMCMHHYKCSARQRDNISIIQFFRNKFLDWSRETKRVFIANRMNSKNIDVGLTTKEFYLENIETMNYYLSQGTVPLQPACAPIHLVRVCKDFFMWVLQVSNNKLYQPTVESQTYSTTMNIARNPILHDYSVDDSVQNWLVNFAQAHLHDPSKDQRIILSIPARKLVYEAYENDFKLGAHFYFPQKKGEYFLPSLSYFMRCWRTNPRLKNIVLRKYLRFSLCDDCIDFRERRRYATTDEERRLIKTQESTHYLFVHEERSTYYIRRNSAIFMKQDYLSLIIDGADQSAYALPHFIEIDKTSANQIKVPVYLMGVLVHGFRTFGFTYLKNIKHGTNIVIECFHQVLVNYKATRGNIPPVIYLQLDNTWKQNKNKYMIGYCACLVAWGVCRQVIISYLPVGHTHEDIGLFIAFSCSRNKRRRLEPKKEKKKKRGLRGGGGGRKRERKRERERERERERANIFFLNSSLFVV